jgi:DNA gyrase subunit A
VDARAVRPDDEVFLISTAGVGTRQAVGKISRQKRDSTGVRVIQVGDGNKLSAAAKISEEIAEEL